MSISVKLCSESDGITGDTLNVLAIDTDFRSDGGVEIWTLIYSRAIVLPENPRFVISVIP